MTTSPKTGFLFVTWDMYVQPMASAPIKPTPEQTAILDRLAVRPLHVEDVEDQETLKVLIAWGWAFGRAGRVQITGSGRYHFGGDQGGGILGEY